MYGWSFGIQDSASGALNSIIQNMNRAVSVGDVLKTELRGVGTVAKEATQGVSFDMFTNIDSTELQLAIDSITESVSVGMETAAASWDGFKDSAAAAIQEIRAGDYIAAIEPISASVESAKDMIEVFKNSWIDVKSVIQSNEILNGVWDKFILYGGEAITRAKSMGSILLFETLPNVLTFAGQGVISLAGYAASLMGTTAAQTALNAIMLANPVGVMVAGFAAVGAAVYGVITYWDDLKGYLIGFGEFFFKYSPFGWVYNVINELFPNLKTAVSGTFTDIWNGIYNTFIKPIADALSWLKNEIASIWENQPTPTVPNIETVPVLSDPSVMEDTPVSEMSLGGKLNKREKQRKGRSLGIGKVKDINGGGGSIKNINQNIQKLVEKVEINVNKANEIDYRKIKDDVVRALLDSANDFNYQ